MATWPCKQYKRKTKQDLATQSRIKKKKNNLTKKLKKITRIKKEIAFNGQKGDFESTIVHGPKQVHSAKVNSYAAKRFE